MGIEKNNVSFLKPQGFFLVAFLLLVSCKNDLNTLPSVTPMDLESDRAEDVKFIFSKEGHTKATLQASEFIRNDRAKPPYVDLKKNLKVEFYDLALNVESTLTAKYARYFPEAGNIIVRDSVTVVNKKGEKLQTEELIWNQKIERFYTEKQVIITKGGQITIGDGMEANQDFTWFRIKNQRGSIPVDKSDLPLE
jgi:LPS export ABC transporter protein LptC